MIEAQLTALAVDTRRQIYAMLIERPRSVRELADELPVTRPAVSQHLKVLMDAGLARSVPVGTRRIYSADPAGVATPANTPRWRSLRLSWAELMRRVFALVKDGGWRLANLDCTLVAQAPRMSAYIPAMRDNLAADLSAEASEEFRRIALAEFLRTCVLG